MEKEIVPDSIWVFPFFHGTGHILTIDGVFHQPGISF
jgi:hypothetical protein